MPRNLTTVSVRISGDATALSLFGLHISGTPICAYLRVPRFCIRGASRSLTEFVLAQTLKYNEYGLC